MTEFKACQNKPNEFTGKSFALLLETVSWENGGNIYNSRLI